jgi:K+-sensing histidine kinase KdpD
MRSPIGPRMRSPAQRLPARQPPGRVARTTVIDGIAAIARFARQQQITQIVIGSSHRSRWRQLLGGGSNVTRILPEAGRYGTDVHVIARSGPGPDQRSTG